MPVSGALLPLESGVIDASCEFRLEGRFADGNAPCGGRYVGGAGRDGAEGTGDEVIGATGVGVIGGPGGIEVAAVGPVAGGAVSEGEEESGCTVELTGWSVGVPPTPSAGTAG